MKLMTDMAYAYVGSNSRAPPGEPGQGDTRIVGSLLAACVEKSSDSSVKRERKRQTQLID
jgi:hypothetical protein